MEGGRETGRQGGRSHICRSCRFSSHPLPHLGTEGKAGKNGSVVESGGRVVSAKRMVGAGDGTGRDRIGHSANHILTLYKL